MKRSLLSLLALLLAFGHAQEDNVVISPLSIVVNPRPSFTVEVWVDKDRSGDGSPTYQIGEEITIGVRASEDAYVYLFNVRSSGEITQILPNRYDQAGQNNRLRAGETKTFPPQGAAYTFNVDGPRGLDKVIAVASKEPLDTRQLADFTADPNFASSQQGEASFAQALSIVVRPKPETSWVTDTALFYVGAAPSAPTYGTLDIRSTPSGAAAYVNGQFVGYTPVRFGTTAGTHTVRLELSGYRGAEQRVTLAGGRTQAVTITLGGAQQPTQGRVSFASTPAAEVILGGQAVGTTPTNALQLPPGTYQATFRRSGYRDAQVSFTVQGGSEQTVRASLERAEAPPVVIGGGQAPPVVIGGASVLSSALGLSAPAGSSVLRLDERPGSLRADISTDLRMPDLWQEFNRQLSAAGWQLTGLERRDPATKFVASYSMGGQRLTLDLDMRGQSGRATVVAAWSR